MVLNTNATFLRICHTIYNEAVPILYQNSWFASTEFSMP